VCILAYNEGMYTYQHITSINDCIYIHTSTQRALCVQHACAYGYSFQQATHSDESFAHTHVLHVYILAYNKRMYIY
jgi:hypothetical protein